MDDECYINGHEYVDLGLSVNWATCNVGASSPSDYGDYFAWGEILPKAEYTEENSVTYGKKMGSIAGDPQYDAATANWGGDWRMPTEEEKCELIGKCTWKWAEIDGHEGYKVTGPNGNSIFLPAWCNGSLLDGVDKSGVFWSALPDEDSVRAYSLYFDPVLISSKDWTLRYLGLPVRPVLNKTKSTSSQTDTQTSASPSTDSFSLKSISYPAGYINGYGYVDLGLSVKWATRNVGASSPSDYGDYYAWGEILPKSEYTEENSVTYNKKMERINGDPQHDAATANWGENWRMPTEVEMGELIECCTWEWTEIDGHKGYKVTGPNGNSIFLPAAGCRDGSSLDSVDKCGSYWSSWPFEDDDHLAIYLNLFSDTDIIERDWTCRFFGLSVRPVTY